MSTNHKTFNLSQSEWIQRSIESAQEDPVGMWQIVRAAREGFDLTGIALEEFVKRFIVAMIEHGADPIIGDKSVASGWSPIRKAGHDPAAMAESLVNHWKAAQVDPDVDGPWFAFPSVWK